MSNEDYNKAEFNRQQDRRYENDQEDIKIEREKTERARDPAYEALRHGSNISAFGAIDPNLAIIYNEMSQARNPPVAEGGKHPTEPHVIASSTPGQWHPEEGYAWVDDDDDDLRVQWHAGRKLSKNPHVVSADREGYWKPEPGYAWIDKEAKGDFRVRWSPGRHYPDCEHVVAADKEGEWKPGPGYVWVDKDANEDFRVRWCPGIPHPDNEQEVASDEVGRMRTGTWGQVGPKEVELENHFVNWRPGIPNLYKQRLIADLTEGKWRLATDEPGLSYSGRFEITPPFIVGQRPGFGEPDLSFSDRLEFSLLTRPKTR